jgi:NtrC-family two-component system sensor histidine kinase KinB
MNKLQTRFILAGTFLALTTVGSGLWSAWTFSRLSFVVGQILQESQETVDLAADLASSLEREDDALLLAVSGNIEKAKRELAKERRRGEECYHRLLPLLRDGTAVEQTLVRSLRADMDAYRTAGEELLAMAGEPHALVHYHNHVNPLLRKGVGCCSGIREENFKQMQGAGIGARDAADKGIWVVTGISIAALVFASIIAVWLARSILLPVRQLTVSVEAIRRGDFGSRVQIKATNELGQLACGFNRMAETLDDYRRSSLGELLSAKITLEATLNALPDAVLVIDPDGALVAVNPPARAVLEAKRATQATRLPDLPLLPEHREAVSLALAGKTSDSCRTDFGKSLAVMLNGRPRKFLVTAVPIPEFAPKRTGAVVVLDDITEFAQLDEMRSELIGVASHELKTPLTTFRMNLLLLGERADNLTTRQREILAAAVAGCEELGATIDELLDVTRIEAGQLHLDFSSVDLYAVLEQTLRRLQSRFEDARLNVQIQRDCPRAVVQADAARLATVLTNVLTNALKYSPAGEKVTIQVASGQNAGMITGSSVQIAVTDRGPGIPAALRQRVFEKFFRVEEYQQNAPNGVRGTGIGLYLPRNCPSARRLYCVRARRRRHRYPGAFYPSLVAFLIRRSRLRCPFPIKHGCLAYSKIAREGFQRFKVIW